MRSRAMVILALLIGTVLILGGHSATAQRGLPTAEEFQQRADRYAATLQPDVVVGSATGGPMATARCGAGGLTPTERALLDAGVARALGDRPAFRDDRIRRNVVSVVFHVVHDGEDGKVARRSVRRQYRIMKKAFRRAKFRFRLEAINYVDKRRWHRRCHKNNVWRQMTDALTVDPEKFLNIYICRPKTFLGAAYLPGPWSAQNWDAVRVLYSTLPGGNSAPYDLGDTVVHEVGHYLGLDHTFYNGCNSPGDAVADTPFEARPDYTCDRTRDTCPQPGLDPVENFMDYGPDTCLREFTPGQRDRMHEQVDVYRPGI